MRVGDAIKMKFSLTKQTIKWWLLTLTVIVSLGLGVHFIPTAFARVADSQVICRVEVDRSVLPANGPQRAVVKVTLDAPPPPETRELKNCRRRLFEVSG